MTNELEERNKKRKQRRNRRRMLSFLGFVLLLIYTPAVWNWFFSANYEIGVIKTATLEIKVPMNGLMIRKETVFKSPGDGFIIPTIQYGGRVGKGNELAAFIKSDLKDIVENYRQMEIEILKRVITEFENTSGTEREFWESAIENQLGILSDLSNTGNLGEAESIRNSVDKVLEAKARYMLDRGAASDLLKMERKELERLRSSIDKSVTGIHSPIAGIVSYHCDGFEELYTPSNRHDIEFDIINAGDEKGNAPESLTPPEISVARDQVYCKVISNDESWLTFAVEEEQGEKIRVLFEKAKLEGKELTFEFEINGIEERINAAIEEVGENVEGYRVMTARMTRFIEKTMNLRNVSGNLILQSVTGMRVPLRSLFNENTVDDTADIAVLEMDKVVFKRVQIVGRQDSYAIIENLDASNPDKSVDIYDIYLVNPKNVVEGQVIDK